MNKKPKWITAVFVVDAMADADYLRERISDLVTRDPELSAAVHKFKVEEASWSRRIKS